VKLKRIIPEFLWGDLCASTLNYKPTLPSNIIILKIAIATIFIQNYPVLVENFDFKVESYPQDHPMNRLKDRPLIMDRNRLRIRVYG
jgi:hypothetical protein